MWKRLWMARLPLPQDPETDRVDKKVKPCKAGNPLYAMLHFFASEDMAGDALRRVPIYHILGEIKWDQWNYTASGS